MAVANKTVAQLAAASKECGKLYMMLQDYRQGNPAPATHLGRYTAAEIETQVTATKTAVDAINAA